MAAWPLQLAGRRKSQRWHVTDCFPLNEASETSISFFPSLNDLLELYSKELCNYFKKL